VGKAAEAEPQEQQARERALERLGGMVSSEKQDSPGRLLHDRVRLGVVSSLAVVGSMSFGELKQILRLTDGNLSAHARKLEEAGVILCRKSFSGRTPLTTYRLTPTGKASLLRYLAHMESLIVATRESVEDES
jgi:DNA-binding HxlR family transcriptional regulator